MDGVAVAGLQSNDVELKLRYWLKLVELTLFHTFDLYMKTMFLIGFSWETLFYLYFQYKGLR